MNDERNENEEPVVGDAPPSARTFLSNAAYDKLKFVAVILLPALGTLYYSLAAVWELPKADEVVGTVVAVDLFLGVILGLSTQQYKNADARFDGQIVLEDDEEAGTTDVNIQLDEAAVAQKDEVLVKVKRKK